MQTASLELCKELYELSGWGETGESVFTKYSEQPESGWRYDTDRDLWWLPAYDLGYLLRKLPKHLKFAAEPVDYRLLLKFEDERTVIGYTFAGWKMFAEADTPEDAACKLAIELIKQGVITATSNQEREKTE